MIDKPPPFQGLNIRIPIIISIEGGVYIMRYTIEYGVSGDGIIIYPRPYSIYLRGTIPHRCRAKCLGTFIHGKIQISGPLSWAPNKHMPFLDAMGFWRQYI